MKQVVVGEVVLVVLLTLFAAGTGRAGLLLCFAIALASGVFAADVAKPGQKDHASSP